MSHAFKKGSVVKLLISKLPKHIQAQVGHQEKIIDARIVGYFMRGTKEYILVGFGELRYILSERDLMEFGDS
jgi:hypothetical protein